jgi:ABC-type multidrug transport system fused ATPase/permease subunit
LSGGQKVRLNIARALYANKDIILLDDPISALDVNVGGFIMEYMIADYLKDKTRVIATHAIQFLKYFDYIYIMDDGQIVKEGDYETVIVTDEYKAIAKEVEKMAEMKKQESAKAGTKAPSDEINLAKVLSKVTRRDSVGLERQDSVGLERQDSTDLKQRESVGFGKQDSLENRRQESDIYMAKQPSIDDVNMQPQTETDLDAGPKDPAEVPLTAAAEDKEELDKDEMDKCVRNITHAEDRATGGIGCDVILNFVKMSGGSVVFYLMGALIAIYVGLQCYGTIYLQDWTESNKDGERRELNDVLVFIGVWGAISIGANLAITFRSLYNFDRILRVAKYLNFYMTFKLLYTSMARFWDRVPLGRVLNRFTRDQNVVDREMGFGINIFVAAMMTCLLDFIMASYSSTPFLWFFIVFYFCCCWLMQRYYMHALRELTRLNAITNTPVVQIFSETLQGINMVRLFRKQKDTRNAYYAAIDENYKNQMMLQGVRSWFKIRIEFFSLLIIIPGFVLCLYLAPSPGAFAVMLKYTLSITEDIGMLMTAMSNNENRFISFERCYHFTQLEPEEGYRGLEETEKKFFAGKSLTMAAPHEQWMTSGELEFKKFSCKYRDDLPMVLKGIDLKVRAGTKVGIVGRTGAGKTTLIKAIYRTFQKYEGEILIDGHEIQSLDVQSLRSRITIIPQDPHLFLDSLRNNLDPQRKFKDEEIIKILQDFGIWEKFEGDKTGGLAFEVQEGGSNLSAGEKQLLVMARALLSKNKLILLDEATANIDVRTEALIQRAVETSFKDCTILMIAHRLNTILFCDKVLCMDKGIIVEYGKTKRLAEDPNSWFGGLMKKGKDIEEALR